MLRRTPFLRRRGQVISFNFDDDHNVVGGSLPPMGIFRDSPMRVFIAACIAAAVIAVCAVVVLDRVQQPADAAYTTEAVRNR
jgi:hypothetical protein